jgi:hypothetical protein
MIGLLRATENAPEPFSSSSDVITVIPVITTAFAAQDHYRSAESNDVL